MEKVLGIIIDGVVALITLAVFFSGRWHDHWYNNSVTDDTHRNPDNVYNSLF